MIHIPFFSRVEKPVKAMELDRAPEVSVRPTWTESEHRQVGIVKDPFNKDCLTGVSLRWFKMAHCKEPAIMGTVEFENGNTKGEQKFEADSMDGLILKVRAFLNTLK